MTGLENEVGYAVAVYTLRRAEKRGFDPKDRWITYGTDGVARTSTTIKELIDIDALVDAIIGNHHIGSTIHSC